MTNVLSFFLEFIKYFKYPYKVAIFLSFYISCIQVKIDSGSAFSRDLVAYKGLWVNQKMDIASDTEDMSPLSVDETLDSGIAFWKGGEYMTLTFEL